MKKALILFCVLALCLSFCACSNQKSSQLTKDVEINVTNQVKNQVTGLEVAWLIGEQEYGKIAADAKKGEYLGEDILTHYISPDTLPENADLSKFALRFTVTDANGTVDVAVINLVPESGKSYQFNLSYADGIYSVFMVM